MDALFEDGGYKRYPQKSERKARLGVWVVIGNQWGRNRRKYKRKKEKKKERKKDRKKERKNERKNERKKERKKESKKER